MGYMFILFLLLLLSYLTPGTKTTCSKSVSHYVFRWTRSDLIFGPSTVRLGVDDHSYRVADITKVEANEHKVIL